MNDEHLQSISILKYQLIGIVGGFIIGVTVGSLFETNNALMLSIFISVIIGEIIALAFYSTNKGINK